MNLETRYQWLVLFDCRFTTPSSWPLSAEVCIAIFRDEAIEAGLIPDDSFSALSMLIGIFGLFEVIEEEVEL